MELSSLLWNQSRYILWLLCWLNFIHRQKTSLDRNNTSDTEKHLRAHIYIIRHGVDMVVDRTAPVVAYVPFCLWVSTNAMSTSLARTNNTRRSGCKNRESRASGSAPWVMKFRCQFGTVIEGGQRKSIGRLGGVLLRWRKSWYGGWWSLEGWGASYPTFVYNTHSCHNLPCPEPSCFISRF